MHKRFWPENLKGKDNSEDLGVDETIILKHLKYIASECVE